MEVTYGTRQHWDRVASTCSTQETHASAHMLDSMLNAVGSIEGKHCLDIGTGMGALPIALIERGAAHALGIDVTPVGIARAEQHALDTLGPIRSDACTFREADAEHLTLETASCDIITCLKTIWCLPQPQACLAEWYRVLTPGGRLTVQIYGPQRECPLLTLAPRILSVFDGNSTMPRGYYGPFEISWSVLQTWLQEQGLRDIQFHEYAIEVPVHSSEQYWQIMRSIAMSAYHTYTRLRVDHHAALEAAWDRWAERIADVDGTVRLGLTWLVAIADKPL